MYVTIYRPTQPYLIGNTHFEAGYYRWAAYGAGSILTEAQWDNFNLVTFTCPSTYGAAARSRFGVPSWLFRYGGDWDNVRLYPNSSAYHGSDMHMVFGNSAEVSGLPEEEAQVQLQEAVMHAWATFAKDPHKGLQELGWSRYENGMNPDRWLIQQIFNTTFEQIPLWNWASTRVPCPLLCHHRSTPLPVNLSICFSTMYSNSRTECFSPRDRASIDMHFSMPRRQIDGRY